MWPGLKSQAEPWPVWLSWSESHPINQRLRVWFLVGVHGWLVASVPGWDMYKRQPINVSLSHNASLPLFLPPFFLSKINKHVFGWVLKKIHMSNWVLRNLDLRNLELSMGGKPEKARLLWAIRQLNDNAKKACVQRKEGHVRGEEDEKGRMKIAFSDASFASQMALVPVKFKCSAVPIFGFLYSHIIYIYLKLAWLTFCVTRAVIKTGKPKTLISIQYK